MVTVSSGQFTPPAKIQADWVSDGFSDWTPNQ